MAPTYTAEAINSLSETEKQRLILAYLYHKDPMNVDWAAAAALSGSKSVNSFRVMFNNTQKKLRKMSDSATGAGDGAGAPAATHTSSPKKRGKAVVADTGASYGDDNPSPKKRGRKKAAKKEIEPKEEQLTEETDDGVVKAEPVSESFFDTEEL